MKIDLDDKTDVLTYHKTLLAKAQKEKDDLDLIVHKWNHSSKNLGKIANYSMSARDKFGLGYGDYRYSGNLSYENEVFQSVFRCNSSDYENPPLHKRFIKTCEMQAVPPPMTGNYLPSGPDVEIDDSKYTYGPEKTQPNEPDSQTNEVDACDSNISTETSELVFEPVVNESHENPHRTLKNKGIIDSGCSRHMTGNKTYLADYQDINGGPVAFGGSRGYITGKGKIQTGKLDFEDVSFVKELQHFNLFSVSQMCDKMNKVLFTDTECLILSPDFKLPDENQILLKVPRQNNIFSWTFFLRSKDETSAILKDFIRQIENQLNQKVKTIRCDNGTEFKNRDINEFCGLKGIKREYSNARTPQQNGVAERKNRTLIEAARTMLADSFLPNTFWAEAVSTACYVLNRVLVTKPHNKTPYELLTGKGPNWLFDLDYLTDSMNYLSVSSENQANIHAGQQETNQNEGSKDKIVAGDSDKEDESAQDCLEVPFWHSYTSTNTSSSKSEIKGGSPREEEQVFLDDLARLQRQEKEANEEAEALTNEGLSLSNTTNSQEDDYEIPPLEDIH
ncbi:ribonuclease H-like domain-containing protein, partial [Tanacetum coccineum]